MRVFRCVLVQSYGFYFTAMPKGGKMSKKRKTRVENKRRYVIHSPTQCYFCGRTNDLTKHHIFEKHFYPNSKELIMLCQSCHSKYHTINNQFLLRLTKDGLLNYKGKIRGNINIISKKLRIWFIEISLKIHFR